MVKADYDQLVLSEIKGNQGSMLEGKGSDGGNPTETKVRGKFLMLCAVIPARQLSSYLTPS